MQSQLAPSEDRGATFSPDRRYRYHLWRKWGNGPWMVWILLNPSTADAVENDPTIERCERRARQMNFGAVSILNLFAYRSTDPAGMLAADDPVGPDNDDEILYHACHPLTGMVICAWGVHGMHRERDERVLHLLKEAGVELWGLGLTVEGYPRHPLYVAYDEQPVRWEP